MVVAENWSTSCASRARGPLSSRASGTPRMPNKEIPELSSQIAELPTTQEDAEASEAQDSVARDRVALENVSATQPVRAVLAVLAAPAAGLAVLLLHQFLPNE